MPLSQTKHTWQEALSNLITDPKELLQLLELDPALLDQANAAAKLFPLKVPRGFAARIEKGNPQDPLLLQVLPLGAELTTTPGFTLDPLGEVEANPIPGLLHKYHGRVLVTLTSACAVHCRYCFRRHFPYADNNPGTRGWEKIINYIGDNKTISEVILSGGDPLSVSDALLKRFTDELSNVKHVKRLRIHTRLPIVLPERVTDELVAWLDQLDFDVVMVVHANHPKEISLEVKDAFIKLKKINLTLLNQSVLLKNVNDDLPTLIQLSEDLFTAGVLPYYLHVLDKVTGAAHFDLPTTRAIQLHQALQQHLPGYLVPKLVSEEAGATAKTLLF